MAFDFSNLFGGGQAGGWGQTIVKPTGGLATDVNGAFTGLSPELQSAFGRGLKAFGAGITPDYLKKSTAGAFAGVSDPEADPRDQSTPDQSNILQSLLNWRRYTKGAA